MTETKEGDPGVDAEAATDLIEEGDENGKLASVEDGSDGEAEKIESTNGDGAASSSKSKKKKSKKARLKKAIGMGTQDEEPGSSSNPASKLTPGMVDQLLEMNPSLRGEVAGMNKEKAAEILKKLDVADLLTGMSVSGKNQKDMASYKFWQTQPVPRFDEQIVEEGPIKIVDPDKISKEPKPLPENYEWVTMDITDENEIREVHELLTGHYVEDDDAKFRLTYSASFLNWALKSPGWRAEWHTGVRAAKSRKLVAFISAVPVALRVRSQVLKSVEINFLCVHKKLRGLRLAPVLIAEITRRCNLVGIYQAIYTAGIVLPKPVSSCRYMHRPLDWLKLYQVGFSNMPLKSTETRQVVKFKLPTSTSTPGLRPMQKKDIPGMKDLLDRYLKKFAMAPEYSAEELEHWLLHDEISAPEQVIWCYVVEDPQSHKITDFFSFYVLESAVIARSNHKAVSAAYLFYYATESAFDKDEKVFKTRLNALLQDALILAKRVRFPACDLSRIILLIQQSRSSTSMSSTHLLYWTTRCSLNSRNLVLAMGSFTTICTTTGPRPFREALMRRIM
jgi:glycylpeptide N-tetradecanoyltransferase